MRHLDLFSGIGGFALATELAFPDEEIEHIFCDNDTFCRAILKKHWPDSVILDDINALVRCLQTPNTNESGENETLTSAGSTGIDTTKRTRNDSPLSIENAQPTGGSVNGMQSSTTTVPYADAAERHSASSSISTIRTTTEETSEGSSGSQEAMPDVSRLGFPTHTKYSALT